MPADAVRIEQTADENWRNKFAAKAAKLDMSTASLEEVKKIFGQPEAYGWGKQVYPGNSESKDLPEQFVMKYPDGFSLCMTDSGKKVVELRYESPGYFFGDSHVQVGSTLDEVLKAVGQPQETVEGGAVKFKDGVLYLPLLRGSAWSS